MSQNPQTTKSRTVKMLQADPNSINRNQLNSSSSKMQYSIPKAKRFADEKIDESSLASSKFYDLPDTKSIRSTSLGYGNKMDLGKQYFQRPSPGQYQIKGEFQVDNKKKGITIAAGREVVKNNSVFEIQKNIPGPGQYNPKNPMIEDDHTKKGFSLASRNKDISDKWINQVPGPGNYETLQLLDKNLRAANSRVRNVQSSKFSKEQRKPQFEQKVKQNVPGPGQYPNSNNVDNTAKFLNKGGFRFSHSMRQGIVEKNKVAIPGPGSYQYFSEFLK